MLDAERIREPFTDVPRLDGIEVFAEIGSTNDYLLAQPRPKVGRCRVALANHQTAGRGRMDRTWESPPSSGLYLSLAYTFARGANGLSGLTLALGIGVAEALERLGIDGIGLKWPNDIIARDGKLGGILTETRSAPDGATVVAGIGVNVDFRGDGDRALESSSIGRIVDLAACTDDVPSRESLAVTTIEILLETLARFDSHGFAPFAAAWQRYDWLRGQTITVDTGSEVVAGSVDGIDSDGALLLRDGDERRSIVSGSVIASGSRVHPDE